jgi:hypothetical protein
MRDTRHWTHRYIYDRLRQIIYQRRHPQAPWLGHEMIRLLENWLSPDDRGFEWGSGRSTIWFAQRVKSLVSIEHNAEWHRCVEASLRANKVTNVEYHLCEDKKEYCRVGELYPQESFDFCLVDGVERDVCALAALLLIRPGGILIVDDCNRYLPTASRSPFSRRASDGPETQLWGVFQRDVRTWRSIWTSNGVTDSGFWVKPAESEPGAWHHYENGSVTQQRA